LIKIGQFESNDRLVTAQTCGDQVLSAGDRANVAIGPQRLNGFDPETGQDLLKDKT
jgi:hypothetical protein